MKTQQRNPTRMPAKIERQREDLTAGYDRQAAIGRLTRMQALDRLFRYCAMERFADDERSIGQIGYQLTCGQWARFDRTPARNPRRKPPQVRTNMQRGM